MHASDALWNAAARDLLRALLRLRTPAETRRFLRDLMTEDEIRMIVDRWRVARMLADGRSYKDIEARTHLSSRTIARISRWLKDGEGGYRLMLARASDETVPQNRQATPAAQAIKRTATTAKRQPATRRAPGKTTTRRKAGKESNPR